MQVKPQQWETSQPFGASLQRRPSGSRSAMGRGDRIFVEFFIPPPPPRSSDSESSDSENQTSEGGIEISGIDKNQSILDISAAVVERGNQETRKQSGKGRTVINVNSIFNQSGESDDYVDSPIPEEDVSDSPHSPEPNSYPLFDHLESRSNSLDSNASAVSSTSEANSMRSASATQAKELEDTSEPISISLSHTIESHANALESAALPIPSVEPKSSDTSVDIIKDLEPIHLPSTDEFSSDHDTPFIGSGGSEPSNPEEFKSNERVEEKGDGDMEKKKEKKEEKANRKEEKKERKEKKVEKKGDKRMDEKQEERVSDKTGEKTDETTDEKDDEKTSSKDNDNTSMKSESKSPTPKSSTSPAPKSPTSPKRSGDDNSHSPNTSQSPRGSQTIVEKVMSPRTDDEESAERTHTRHSSPYEKTSSSSPMELAQDFMVMLNKSPMHSTNRSFFGSSPHGYISHTPQPSLGGMSRVDEESTSPEGRSGSLDHPFHIVNVDTVSSVSGQGVDESITSQENPLLDRKTSHELVKKESNRQPSSVNDMLNESDQMASDIAGVETPSLPSSLKESGTC